MRGCDTALYCVCNAGATTQFAPCDPPRPSITHWRKRHSSINSAIFMTHGVPAQVPGVLEPVEIFASVTRSDHEPLSEAFAVKIRNAWMQHQANKKPILPIFWRGRGETSLNAANARARQT